MKVIYKNAFGGSLNSGGVKFVNGKEYEVTEAVGKYLVDAFGDKFEVVEEKVVTIEKPKETIKPKAKPKATKKVVETKED